ncbi:MAG: ATP-dependent Clp protease ATP-binding subunit [Gammaproteobacteria bacterium]|nr:ATP-dependent Clp protease ATP-binding subunit [Gammaproteobacteria bacterium]
MILIDADSPRWLRELDRFIHLKSLLLLHGNVLDLVSCQVESGDGRRYWTESNLGDFFKRLLPGMGYGLVGLFDPVDGLQFAQEEMAARYRELAGDGADSPARRGQSDSDLQELGPLLPGISRALANRTTPCAFLINFASRLTSSPERLAKAEQALFTRILKASLEAREVIGPDGSHNNLLILVCDKINDLPTFLYLNNPRSRSIHIDHPGIGERQRFIRSNYRAFFGASSGASSESGTNASEAPPELVALFSALTDGFSTYEMLSLIGLSQREQIPVERLRNLCERFKYGIVESDWDKLDRSRLDQARQLISGRIKGQELALNQLLEIVKRAKLGMAAGSASRSQRPRGVLFFAGPTGVGKTEMAKGLAELLFGQDDRLIRFDMSEFAAAHADQKLLGAPPGYVGYEEGGKLTNAMKQQPFSVLLFDEVEKAHPSIFDKFLQILDDGRLTDGKGETVYFSECIIIFTSNLGTYTPAGGDGSREKLVSPEMPYSQVRDIMLGAIRHHFNQVLGRPEILNRFGENFVVFDYIRPPLDGAILDHLLRQLGQSLREQQGLELNLNPEVREQLGQLASQHLEFGGRGIRNLLEAALVNPLASQLFDQNPASGSRVLVSQLQQAADGRYRVQIQVTGE